jgi:DNA-binding transcriptional ArsR family regulator
MSDVFEILAEPTRRRILVMLRAGERPVGDLVDDLGLSQPAVSKHLKVLRDSGLVGARVDAQRRVYRLVAEPLAVVDDWVAPFRRYWSKHLDALERHLDAMPDDETEPKPQTNPKNASPIAVQRRRR